MAAFWPPIVAAWFFALFAICGRAQLSVGVVLDPQHPGAEITDDAKWDGKWDFQLVPLQRFQFALQVEPQTAAPVETNYFRRVVTIPAGRKIRRAIFEYTGDNECRGWIDQFDLGARNNFNTVKWNDITTRLEPGKTYLFGLTGRNEGTEPNPAGVTGKLTVEFGGQSIRRSNLDQGIKIAGGGWRLECADQLDVRGCRVLSPDAAMKLPETWQFPDDASRCGKQCTDWSELKYSESGAVQGGGFDCIT